jgi:ABC-type amino acid transport substrate-binding protein
MVIVVAVALGGGMIGATRMIVTETSGGTDRNAKAVAGMDLVHAPVPAEVLKQVAPNPVPLKPQQSRLDRIRERKVIRVGFNPDDLPFSYFNAEGKLVGFDIDMAYSLAGDLGVSIEFVPFETPRLSEQLDNDDFDTMKRPFPTSRGSGVCPPLRSGT